MPTRTEVQEVAGLLRACGDVTRLRILNLLRDGEERCVYDLVAVTGASQPKVSRHLAYLRRAGLVRYRKDGLWVYYRSIRRPDERTALLLEALGRSFDLLPDMERDLEVLDRLKGSREGIAASRQGLARPVAQPETELLTNTHTAEASRSREAAPELEVELL